MKVLSFPSGKQLPHLPLVHCLSLCCWAQLKREQIHPLENLPSDIQIYKVNEGAQELEGTV